jgi:hypothetical protein
MRMSLIRFQIFSRKLINPNDEGMTNLSGDPFLQRFNDLAIDAAKRFAIFADFLLVNLRR